MGELMDMYITWTASYPTTMGPKHGQISETIGYVKRCYNNITRSMAKS